MRDDEEAWQRSKEDDYKVYKKEGGLYTVVGPGGGVVGCRYTLRGCRKMIREHRKNPPLPFWETAIVYSEEK